MTGKGDRTRKEVRGRLTSLVVTLKIYPFPLFGDRGFVLGNGPPFASVFLLDHLGVAERFDL